MTLVSDNRFGARKRQGVRQVSIKAIHEGPYRGSTDCRTDLSDRAGAVRAIVPAPAMPRAVSFSQRACARLGAVGHAVVT